MDISNRYLVNAETVAILPEFKVKGAKAQIIERNRAFFVNQTPLNIIESSLLMYGANLKGARQSSLYHMGAVHRPPLMISGEKDIFFYTSEAMSNPENIWLSVSFTKRLIRKTALKTEVICTNGLTIEINVSHGSLSNNYLRGLHLKKLKDEMMKESTNSNQVSKYPVPESKEPQLVRDSNALSYIFKQSE